MIFKIWIHILISKFFNIVKNREAYPEGAREFTFGECIWFCLTSLTPQGGGECPKVKIRKKFVFAGSQTTVSVWTNEYGNLVKMYNK